MLTRIADGLFDAALGPIADLGEPAGDPGLFGPESMAWRVHANPVSLAVGGMAAVILELAEPRVRAGVWSHSTFPTEPLGRMRRTAMAALLTTFGPSKLASARIDGVGRMHARIWGTTPQGEAYDARDPELCDWVHVTAGFGFLEAYRRLVEPDMPIHEQDRYWAEGSSLGRAFGAGDPPTTAGRAREMVEAMRPRLERSAVGDAFLRIVSRASPLGPASRPLQPLMVRGAIALLPDWARGSLADDRPLAQAAALSVLGPLARAAPAPPLVRAAYARVGLSPPR